VNKKKYFLCITIFIFLIFFSLLFINNKKNNYYNKLTCVSCKERNKKNIVKLKNDSDDNSFEEEDDDENIILPFTEIIYKYYYELDNCSETVTERAPCFLIGMTKKEFQDKFCDWDVEFFSKDKIIIKKNICGKSNQHYVVSIKNNYVVVYYKEPINGIKLKEITNIHVDSLSDEDKIKLKDGINIVGEDKLNCFLQDYES
jgi:hypothetical protein